MRLKSFFGPTLSEAMAQVRAALGDNAIIISTRDEEATATTPKGVRVTAALDEQAVSAAPATPQATQHLVDTLNDDVMDVVADALQRHGTPASLAEKIAAHAARHAAADAAATLAHGLTATLKFGTLPAGSDARMILLIGPPGAGKTAMIGKLAARAALAGKKVAAISTDLERAGGVAQLSAYTQSLRIPLMEVEDASALHDALHMYKDTDQIFIDSSGINPFNPSEAASLMRIIKATSGPSVLVLPAGLEPLDAAEMALAFKSLGAQYLLPTRLDLARRLGSLLAVAHDARLPLCEASASHSIAAGLVTLDAASLAQRLIVDTDSQPDSLKTSNANHAKYGKR